MKETRRVMLFDGSFSDVGGAVTFNVDALEYFTHFCISVVSADITIDIRV